ncbi:MAG: methyltransferase [Clostridia bacterium]|nr:methyltransferase [Clostridia bacterium]
MRDCRDQSAADPGREKRSDELFEGEYFAQFRRGFSFGTDAVLLADFVRLPSRKLSGVEFGTGSGVIPVLLSRSQDFKSVTALEIDPDYAALAEENFASFSLQDRVRAVCGDLNDAQKLLKAPVDFVFTNPPYVKLSSGFASSDPKRLGARHELFCTLAGVCRAASAILKNGGLFFAVCRPDRLADMLCSLRENGLEPKNLRFVDTRGDGKPELFLIRAVKGAAPGMNVEFRRLKNSSTRTMESELYED